MLSRGTAALVAAGGARFAYQAARDPLHVVWDLDSTLISSQLLPDAERFASHVDEVRLALRLDGTDGATLAPLRDAYAALSKAALARGFGPVPEFGPLR